MSSKWGGSCTFSGSTDKSSGVTTGDSTASVSCPIYTSTNGVTYSGTSSATYTAHGDVGGTAGINVNIPFP
ncbi:unnamed protein product [Adineta steineri]|uniref:Uncharacterized protein n=1 Tax=Adineta steineri TaxID=433720 RepID=A0A813WMD5_9BILA|nr:unnamed protein product [Adineta steineri]CAF1279282.1 unnamed protein product [Adineta steineri]CAF3606218.1 unnamed protein product [Adineta steineri]CAF3720145.1 unnamed protein product [Adineta steineri]